MKLRQEIYWLVAILAVAGVWYALSGGTSQVQQQAIVAQNPQVATAAITDSSANYDVVVKYPQFGVPAFDSTIKQSVDTAVTEIKNTSAPDPATYKNALDIRFSDPYIGPDILSVVLAVNEYTGGAHPMTIISGLNYDRATGKILTLNDVLPMIGLTVDQVSTQAMAQLKANFKGTIFPEGLTPNPENFSSFIVSADKVTFIFQPYQVAAYAAGPQQVSFPRTK